MSKEKMPLESFSPALRDCMKEIESSLKKYDAMGFVILQSPQHTEFKLFIEGQAWSIFQWLPRGADGRQALSMKFRKENHANGEFCIGAIWSFRRLTKSFALFFDSLANKAESKMEINSTIGDIHNEGRG